MTDELALARARALQDADDERAELASAAATRRARRAVGPSWAESAAGPSGLPLRGGPPPPPGGGGRVRAGRSDQGTPDARGVARGTDTTQADAAGLPPAGRPALVLTESEHLSLAIERRRRALLVTAREHWESRAWYVEGEVARYHAESDELAHQVEAAEAAELWTLARQLGARLDVARASWRRAVSRKKYATARVKSLTSDLSPRLAKCGAATRWLRCGCEGGLPRPIDAACGQRAACAECRRRWAGRMRKRLLAVLPEWIDRARDERGRGGRVRLITLTIAHSGDLARDRAELVEGWVGLRKQLGRWFGAPLPYALVWETTPGRDGQGHEHAHVIAIGGPPRWNYAAIQRTWRTMCPRSSHLDIQLAGARRPGRTSCDPVKAAAYYLGKYATKGVEIGGAGWSDELVAQVLAAHYGKRGVSTSHGFWHPLDPICEACGCWIHRAAQPDLYYRVARVDRVVWGPCSDLATGPPAVESPLICN